MTDYLKPKFTLPAGPTKDVPWPFDDPDAQPAQDYTQCGECGAVRMPGRAHIDQRDADAKRPRKRVCFGKVIAG